VHVWRDLCAVRLRKTGEVIATALWPRRATVWSHGTAKEMDWPAQSASCVNLGRRHTRPRDLRDHPICRLPNWTHRALWILDPKVWRSTSVCSPLRLQRPKLHCSGEDQLLANSQGVQLKKAKERSRTVRAAYLGSALVVKPVLQAHALRAYYCGCVVLWSATRELAPRRLRRNQVPPGTATAGVAKGPPSPVLPSLDVHLPTLDVLSLMTTVDQFEEEPFAFSCYDQTLPSKPELEHRLQHLGIFCSIPLYIVLCRGRSVFR
jgi:hypothetical protein